MKKIENFLPFKLETRFKMKRLILFLLLGIFLISSLSLVSAILINTTMLNDTFDRVTSNWTTDCNIEINQYVSAPSSIGCASEDNDLVSIGLNMSNATTIFISFSYKIEGIDANDDVIIYYYNGTVYNPIDEIGDDAENTWLTYSSTITDTQYFNKGFKIYIEGSSIDSEETLWIDDVVIVKEYDFYSDSDNDGIPDVTDNLEGNLSSPTTSGISNLNITIGGNSTLGSFDNVQKITFYDNNIPFMNFTHNFTANKIDLSKVSIEKTGLSLVVNLSEQLASGEKKTIYLDDNSFISLCVKDDNIASVSQISSDCNGTNETDFTSCLGNSTGVTINNITCYDEGLIIRIENLSHSGIKGTHASSPNPASSPSGGGGGGGGVCSYNWNCAEWSICTKEEKQTRTCNNIGTCSNGYNPPKTEQTCIYLTTGKALFDIALTIIKPQIPPGEALTAKISLINFGNKTNPNVNVSYMITDSNNKIILREKEVVPVGLQNEFIKEFVLPSQINPGEYKLFVEINYEGQEKEAASQGSFKILSKKQGFFSLTGNAIWDGSGKINYLAMGILLLLIITLIIIYILIKSKYIKKMREDKKLREEHKIREKIKTMFI